MSQKHPVSMMIILGQAEWRRGLLQLHRGGEEGGLPLGQEVAAEEETPSRAGAETRLERLLGLSKRHNTSFLPVRLERGKNNVQTITPPHLVI